MTTLHDSFCLFAWNYRGLAKFLFTLYVTGRKVVSNPGLFGQGSSGKKTVGKLIEQYDLNILDETTTWDVIPFYFRPGLQGAEKWVHH